MSHLVGGTEKVFEIGRHFRTRGQRFLAFPAFAMLEYYRTHATYDPVVVRTGEFVPEAEDAVFSRETPAEDTRTTLSGLDVTRYESAARRTRKVAQRAPIGTSHKHAEACDLEVRPEVRSWKPVSDRADVQA